MGQDLTSRPQRDDQRAHALTIPPLCLFDLEAPNQLQCLVCRDHRLLLLLPERRAVMLALLLRQGQLYGQAKEEAERPQSFQFHP